MTIHPTQHIDYSKGDRVDHLFVVEGDHAPVLLSVTDTGLDLVLDAPGAWGDRTPTKGWSLTWAEVITAVRESDHNGVVTLTTVRSTADVEHVSRCGYCGDVIDYCQGHGEDERAEFGFDYDSDEYEARREPFEAADDVTLVEHKGTLDEFHAEMAALRKRAEEEALTNG